jgi:hypothetical protein
LESQVVHLEAGARKAYFDRLTNKTAEHHACLANLESMQDVARAQQSNHTVVAGLARACGEDLRRLQHEYDVMLDTATKDTTGDAPSPAEVALRLEHERKLLASHSETARLTAERDGLEAQRQTLEGTTKELEDTAVELRGEMEAQSQALLLAEETRRDLQRNLEKTQTFAAVNDKDDGAIRVDRVELEVLQQSAAQVLKLEEKLAKFEARQETADLNNADVVKLESEMLVLSEELVLLRETNEIAQEQVRQF